MNLFQKKLINKIMKIFQLGISNFLMLNTVIATNLRLLPPLFIKLLANK